MVVLVVMVDDSFPNRSTADKITTCPPITKASYFINYVNPKQIPGAPALRDEHAITVLYLNFSMWLHGLHLSPLTSLSAFDHSCIFHEQMSTCRVQSLRTSRAGVSP